MFLIIGCGGALIIAAATILTNRRAAKTGGPRMPLTNPYRIGAYVLITEDLNRPDMSFYATVMSNAGGMCTVREASAPYASVTIPKEYVYPGGTIL